MTALTPTALITATPADLDAMGAGAMAEARRVLLVAAYRGTPGAADALTRVEAANDRRVASQPHARRLRATVEQRRAADRLFDACWQTAGR